jgi:hypothetical protein
MLLPACATNSGPLFTRPAEATSEKAIVYIYRTSDAYRQALESYQPRIYVDERPSTVITRNGYSALYLEPGVHHLTIQYETGICKKEGIVNMDVKSEFRNNSVSYYRIDIALEPVDEQTIAANPYAHLCLEWITTINPVSEDFALKELRNTRLVINN